MREISYDGAAVLVMLSSLSEESRRKALAALAHHAEVASGSRCLYCDSVEVEADATNAARRCRVCGEQWDMAEALGAGLDAAIREAIGPEEV